jgi:hypothetical protein
MGVVVALSIGPGVASAADGDLGWPGFSYGTQSQSVTTAKPESKLWFNRGWWATMIDPFTNDHHIFRFDRGGQRWRDTRVPVDDRGNARADVLWDDAHDKLYIASHRVPPLWMTELPDSEAAPPPVPTEPAVSPSPARLYRYSYDAAADSYTVDPGFPAAINTVDSETLVIARDSLGTLWATWTAGNQVYVSHTVGDDATWAPAYPIPAPAATVTQDDIASVIAFGDDKIGVLWSNQADGRYSFAVHVDGAMDAAPDWSVEEIPDTPPSDDHVNLKADAAGRVYAVVKHTNAPTDVTEPSVSLLVRSTSGSWARDTVTRSKEEATRPIVLIDERARLVHVFFTGPQPPDDLRGDGGGTIYTKTSPLKSIRFATGPGTPVIRDADSSDMNDATSTKQDVDDANGVVVLANNPATNTYWHYDSLAPAAAARDATGTAPPNADTGAARSQAVDPGPPGGGSSAGVAPPPGPRPRPPVLGRLTIAAIQRGGAVRGAVIIGRDGSRLRAFARVRGRKAIVGRSQLAVRRAGRATFRIVLSRSAKAALRRSRRLALAVTVRVTPPGGAPATATRRVVVRPRLSR